MARNTLLEESLFARLATFRPSDREEFRRAFQTQEGVRDAHKAIARFVRGWEDGQWVESYSIERIAKWLAVNAPEKLVTDLSRWANERQTIARQALRRGFRSGKSLPVEDQRRLSL
jgi:hypothetical protein